MERKRRPRVFAPSLPSPNMEIRRTPGLDLVGQDLDSTSFDFMPIQEKIHRAYVTSSKMAVRTVPALDSVAQDADSATFDFTLKHTREPKAYVTSPTLGFRQFPSLDADVDSNSFEFNPRQKREPRAYVTSPNMGFRRVSNRDSWDEDVDSRSFSSDFSSSFNFRPMQKKDSPRVNVRKVHFQTELEPEEYAWLIQQEFASSIKYRRRARSMRSSRPTAPTTPLYMLGKPGSKKSDQLDLSSVQHLDLATAVGHRSLRHSLVEEVISDVLARALKTADLSRLHRLGLPPKYLPTIAEAMQAEHLSELKHLDLANSGSLGQKSLELRKLVETRLPTFLSSCKVMV